MLDSLRKHATGWVAKVLFGFLVLSFAIWGIGDIFRVPQGGGTVAEVAGSDVSVQEVGREFENRVARMQEQFGATFDRRTAASLGVLQQAVDSTVARRLVDAHARELELTAADDTVAELIRNDPGLQGTGGFERERFDLFLRQIGLTEAQYIELVRTDLVRNELIGAMTGPVQVPEMLARKLVEFRLEQRRGQAAIVDAASIEVEAPSDEALSAYLAANANDLPGAGISQHHAGHPGARGPPGRDRGLRRRSPGGLRRADGPLPHARAAQARAAAGARRGHDQARGRAGGRRAELHPGRRGAEGRQGRADGGRAPGQGRPARGPGRGRLRTGARGAERAGADAVRLASPAPDWRSCPRRCRPSTR